jgi:threonine dehydrogenase-like Zn-dependent dehydrogenase
MALKLRGIAVTLCSLESPASDRAKLAQAAGVEYATSPPGQYDIVIEAAGPAQAAIVALDALAPAGVFVTLGVNRAVEISMLQLILKNQAIVGSVNASPADFLAAVADLERFPADILTRMVQKERWSDFRSTLTGPLRSAPKVVHVAD